MSSKETELNDLPTDGITTVKFCPDNKERLLVTSWDASARVYDVTGNRLLSKCFHKGAVLDGCFVDDTHTVSGGLDKNVLLYDHNVQKETVIGCHEQPIRCVEYIKSDGLILTGGWDGLVKVWDSRQSSCLYVLQQPSKVYTLAQCTNKFVVGTAGRSVMVYDFRRLPEVEQQRTSPLKYQTRCIRCFSDSTGFALASVEGRIAIEYFDQSPETQKHKYAFKCHRENVCGTETIYPVNALAFHPVFGTFASGGADGYVNIWDAKNTRRLIQLHRYQTSISSLAFNENGTNLAIAVSYTFEMGEKEAPKDTVYVRKVDDAEVKPKPKIVK